MNINIYFYDNDNLFWISWSDKLLDAERIINFLLRPARLHVVVPTNVYIYKFF